MKDLIYHNIYNLWFYKCDHAVFESIRKKITGNFVLEQFASIESIKPFLNVERFFVLLDLDQLNNDDIKFFSSPNNDLIQSHIIWIGNSHKSISSNLIFGKSETEYSKIILLIKYISQQEIYAVTLNNVLESIVYAGKIQNAILPDQEILSNNFSEYFIYNNPRDIVSGDFYWFANVKDIVFVAVGDCTGHGVPGAFMSILGITLLNEILYVDGHYETDIILNNLKQNIIGSLSQSFNDSTVHDGMDISLCAFRLDYDILQFSGAFNPAIVIRNDEVIELKADRMPVGIYTKDDKAFSKEYFDLKKGDKIYLFSDGYSDQTGGLNSKKLRKRKFLDMLMEIRELPLKSQHEYLMEYMEKWKGINEQIDDMMIVGLKI